MLTRIDLRDEPAACLTRRRLDGVLPRAELDVEAAVAIVRPVCEDVRDRGAEAVREHTARFDGVDAATTRVPREALAEALAGLDPAVVAALREAAARARLVHQAQLPCQPLAAGQVLAPATGQVTGTRQEPSSAAGRVTAAGLEPSSAAGRVTAAGLEPSSAAGWVTVPGQVTTIVADGTTVTERYVPVERAGVYVPGGLVAYPSSVVMNVIPAQVAGVSQIAVASPPRPEHGGLPHPAVLAACELLGITEVHAVGGAQAIAMLGYGTADCAAVDTITGPGNVYVAAAKRLLRGIVGTDAEAGPTEIAIIADSTADPVFVAADLIAQAEHDSLAACLLITTDPALAGLVDAELTRQADVARHADRVKEALAGQGACVLVSDIDCALAVADAWAPEHLEIQADGAGVLAGRVRNAGAVFVGPYAPVSLGDYLAGSNHVLPTGGTARYSGGLSVLSFLRVIHVVNCTQAGLAGVAAHVDALGGAEDLAAHVNAVRVRVPACRLSPDGPDGALEHHQRAVGTVPGGGPAAADMVAGLEVPGGADEAGPGGGAVRHADNSKKRAQDPAPSGGGLPLRPELVGRAPYGAPQLDVAVRLNTNENPYQPPPALVARIAEAARHEAAALNRYPDRDAVGLRRDLAAYLGHGLTAAQIWPANGSNEVIQQLFQAFGGPGRRALGFEPSYSMHPLIAMATSTQWLTESRNADFGIDADRAVTAIGELRPDLVFVTSPNNPTGTTVPVSVIERICAAAPGVVVVDEAYAEFARDPRDTALALLPRFGRLVVVRTMSKAFALAGARVGYLVADPGVVDALQIVRLPYHLSALTQATARAALACSDELLATVAAIRAARDELSTWLRGQGLAVADSDANFVLFGGFGVEQEQAIWQGLLDRGVLIRQTGPPGWLRVSVGTSAEMAAFRAALTEVLAAGVLAAGASA